MTGRADDMAAETVSDRKRAFAARGRTGCTTCRTAHVRCDEGKPSCRRCTRLSLGCVYRPPKGSRPEAGAKAAVRPLAPAVSSSLSAISKLCADLSPHGVTYFEYFRVSVVPQLCKRLDGPLGFWSTTLLRECLLDQSVVDAIIGIAALSRARREGVPQKHLTDHDQVVSSRHYSPAVQHYTRAISAFRTRIDNIVSNTSTIPPRSLLVFTILFSIFETLHGNTNAFDHLAAHGIRLFNNQLRTRSRLPASASLDDDEIYDAECFLTRTATWSTLFAPMYPQSRQVLASLAARHGPRDGQKIVNDLPSPPDRRAASIKDFWRGWWQFITGAVNWHLRAQTLLKRGSSDHQTITRRELEGEQEILLAKTMQWEVGAQSRLEDHVRSYSLMSATSTDRDAFREYLEDKRMLRMLNFDTKIAYLSNSYALDDSDSAWQDCIAECDAALDIGEDVVADMTAPENAGYDMLLSDGGFIGLLNIARECRDKRIRFRALQQAKSLVTKNSTWHVKSLVMGTIACVDASELGRDASTGDIGLVDRWDWTGADWSDGYETLKLTLTSRGIDEATGMARQKIVVLGTDVLDI